MSSARGETARRYVQATRPATAPNWFIARDDLGTDGQDPARLTQHMTHSRAQTPSLAHPAHPVGGWHQAATPSDSDPSLASTLAHPYTAPRCTRIAVSVVSLGVLRMSSLDKIRNMTGSVAPASADADPACAYPG